MPDDRLAAEIKRVADALEVQNEYKRRFLSGIVFGVGTAIGASVIAAVIVATLTRILDVTGLEGYIQPKEPQQLLEEQIKQQTPQ